MTVQTSLESQPSWTDRGHRSIPKVEMPRLSEVAPEISTTRSRWRC